MGLPAACSSFAPHSRRICAANRDIPRDDDVPGRQAVLDVANAPLLFTACSAVNMTDNHREECGDYHVHPPEPQLA